MTYSFDSLYQDWVTHVLTNIPSTPDKDLTVEKFVISVQMDIDDMINEGEKRTKTDEKTGCSDDISYPFDSLNRTKRVRKTG